MASWKVGALGLRPLLELVAVLGAAGLGGAEDVAAGDTAALQIARSLLLRVTGNPINDEVYMWPAGEADTRGTTDEAAILILSLVCLMAAGPRIGCLSIISTAVRVLMRARL